MTKTAVQRVAWYILAIGVVVVLLQWVLGGADTALSGAAGVAVAVANWQLLRFIVGRVVAGTVQNQALFAFVLIFKMGALMALIFVLLRSGLVEPIAFTAGVSSLVVGAISGTLFQVLTAKPVESER